jgi:hypothetical protein
MVRILKNFSGKTDTTTISSHLSMTFFIRHFVSLKLDASKILPDVNQPAPEVCSSRSLGSKANTPEADENEKKSNDDEDSETDQDNNKGKEATVELVISSAGTETRTKGDGHMSKSDAVNDSDSSAVVGKNNDTDVHHTSVFSFLQSDTTSANSAIGTTVSPELRELDQALELTTAPASTPTSPMSTLTNDVAPATSASDTEPTSHAASVSAAEPASPAASASATELISIPDSMEVDQVKTPMEVVHKKGKEAHQEKGEESHTSSSTNVTVVAAPAWLTKLGMDDYFQECSDEKAWRDLVQSLYRFEQGNTINGVCITTTLLLVFIN